VPSGHEASCSVPLAGKLTGGPAGQSGGHIPGLIRRLAAVTVNYGRAKQRRTWVFARALMHRFGQLDLPKRACRKRARLKRNLPMRDMMQMCWLERDLSALGAFIAV
jgi:hypothetical protein